MAVKSTSSSPSSTYSTIISAMKSSLQSNIMIDKITQADRDLDKILAKQPMALKLERQLGIKKTYAVYVLATAIIVSLLYRFAPVFVSTIVLFAYPLLLSLEAVESHDKAKDAHILSYWSVIASLNLLETLVPFLFTYIPFYRMLKMALAVWMFLPQTKGSLVVFEVGFKPILKQVKAVKRSAGKSSTVPLKKSDSKVDEGEN